MFRTTLTISTESRSYTVQGTTADVDALFDHLVSETFKPVSATTEVHNEPDFAPAEAPSEEPVVHTTFEESAEPSVATVEEPTEEVSETECSNTPVEEEAEPRKYRGFLLIKCKHCGEVRGFNSRNDISSYKCDCGGETPLGKLVPLTALCECGKRWRYLTNLTEDSYEMNCIHCGSPIPVFFNEKKRKYETLLEAIPPQKGKKKGGKK